MTTQAEQLGVIETWMTTIVGDGGIERYDDLHIDTIDDRWAQRVHWMRGGLEAFRLARRLRDQHGLALTIGLAYSLESGEGPLGVNFRTPHEFQAQLDWSPPSLYLFHPDHEPWTEAGGEVAKPLGANALFGITPGVKACYYMEFRPPNSTEYSRSVFVAG